MSHFFPHAHFVGYEIVKHRVREANRIFQKHALNNCEVLQTNILDAGFVFPEAQVYFIYDFGEVSHIQLALSLIIESNGTQTVLFGCKRCTGRVFLNQQVALNQNWREQSVSYLS